MLRPEKAEYFYNRGNCYNKMGETQKAVPHLGGNPGAN